MTNTWLNKLGRLCLSLVVLDYVSVAIAEEAAALAFGGGGGSSSSAAGGLFHHVGKRMELQSCIMRFDVKLDMIIRTEESRAMGAKFLDHADLGSREECLRLCCETEDCDVFVFEEKNEGTCFLFECGPAQNFRCKFTHHANYTSAVMTPPVQKPEPPPTPPPPPPRPVQIATTVAAPLAATMPNRSKHEMELSNLLEKPISSAKKANAIIPNSAVETRIVDIDADKTVINVPKQPTAISSGCSRFQFQCHSGECIAVYNACDGIPQCVDGSDEGPECPSTPTVKPIRKTQHSAAETIPIDMRLAAKPLDQQQPLQQQQQIQQQLVANIQRAEQKSQSSSLDSRIAYGSLPIMPDIQRNREDPMTAPEWPSAVLTAQQQMQLQQQQMQQSSSQMQILGNQGYGGNTASRIFSHKGGLQLSESSPINPSSPLNVNDLSQQYINNNNNNNNNINGYALQSQVLRQPPQIQQQRPPPPIQSIRDPYMQPMQDVYRIPQWSDPQRVASQQLPQWPQDQIQQQGQLPAPPLVATRDEMIQLQQQPEWPVRPILPVIPSNTNTVQTANIQPAVSNEKSLVKPKTISDSDEDNAESNDELDDELEKKTKATEAPVQKKKQRIKHRKGDGGGKKAEVHHEEEHVEKRVKEQLRRIKTDMEMEFMDHDGAAERPGGAVLSLTLGLIVTAALVVLVGCRATVVRRRVRGRAGKGPYAHDADFLVNGMYL